MNVRPQMPTDNAAFLDWVQGRQERYELAAGRIVAMSASTTRHGLIVGNLFELLRRRIDRNRWVVVAEFGIDVRPGTVKIKGWAHRPLRWYRL